MTDNVADQTDGTAHVVNSTAHEIGNIVEMTDIAVDIRDNAAA